MLRVGYDATITLHMVEEVAEDDLVDGTLEQIRDYMDKSIMYEIKNCFYGEQKVNIDINSNLNISKEE